MKKPSANAANWGMLVLLGLIWGSSFILIKKGLVGLSAIQVACLRIVISMIALSPLLLKHLSKVPKDKWLAIFGVGFFGSGVPPFMFALAQTRIDSGLTGIINATTPLFAFLLGILFFGLVFQWIKLAGVVMGLAGSAVLILLGTGGVDLSTYGYGALILVATIGYGTSANIIGRYLKSVNPLTISAVSFLMIGIPALAILLSTDFIPRLSAQPEARVSLGYVAILGVIGTGYASVIFFFLTQRTNALFASTVTYLIPIVALLWGAVVGEIITPWHFVGMVLILLGVYLSSNRAAKLWQRLWQKSPHSPASAER